MKRSLESNNSTDNNGHEVSKIANRKDSTIVLHPTNPLVGPLLTDMYQISMTYAHWKSNRYNDDAVFDLFFRTNPFRGEYCIFAGSDEVLRFVSSFKFSESDVDYLRELMGECDPKFFDWLLTLDCSKVKVYMMQEGSVVFPREPLIRIEGPLVIGQLLETTLLNLINFPSLIATCATRMRIAAGKNKTLLEFGLRRAQGPDGGLSASKYAYLGGFNGTSNVLSGKLFGLKVSGTIAHAYVMAHVDIESLHTRKILNKLNGIEIDFVDLVLEIRTFFGFMTTNIGELAAFIEYAQAFPHGFLALVDTYDTLQSGVPNFIVVAVALYEIGYVPKGIRLDSGDLAYLSKETRKMFHQYEEIYNNSTRKATTVTVQLSHLTIVASNDINEKVIRSLNEEKHEIDTFGIGTHLVTCFDQPALGCVYKLVEINQIPRIKLSQNVDKLVIPGSKSVYRLYGKDGRAILDRMQFSHEPVPLVNVSILCRDPFREDKRAYVTPLKVVPLLNLIWDHGEILINSNNSDSNNNNNSNSKDTNGNSNTDSSSGSSTTHQSSSTSFFSLDASRSHCEAEINSLREDHVRGLNPTPYKVSVSQALYDFLHQLWSQEAPIGILS